jgi:hypothetical protein
MLVRDDLVRERCDTGQHLNELKAFSPHPIRRFLQLKVHQKPALYLSVSWVGDDWSPSSKCIAAQGTAGSP